MIYGLVLLMLVFMFPQGLAPLFERLSERLARTGRTGTEPRS